jgi:phospholipid/cholesterol/gamma-HCH transport system ATP-binding protein
MSTESNPTTPAVEFRNVSFSFGEKLALRSVSFEVEPHQMLIVTGASGSGKSVLLHVAIGLLRPDEGQVFIEGQDLAQLDESELLSVRSERMGLVFQEDTLFTGIDTYENTAYRLVEHGWKEQDIDRAVNEILTFVGLEGDVDKLPEELSIGMRRRLELARALAGWPPIMLYDEPTIGLDPINARQVLDLIIRARDVHKISSLVVTKELHQIPHLVKYAAVTGEDGSVTIQPGDGRRDPPTMVMMLDEGEIGFYGTPEEFQQSALPAVRYLTHPETGMRIVEFDIPDPWGKARRIVPDAGSSNPKS